MKLKAYLPLFLVVGACAAPAVQAADGVAASGWYGGISVGQSKYKHSLVGNQAITDDKDTGWKLFAGYQFLPAVAAEVGWADLGKASLLGGSEFKAKDAFFADVVGTLPFNNNFAGFAKVGAYSVKSEGPGFSDRNSDWKWGLGVAYQWDRNWGARLEWERFNKVESGPRSDKDDVDLTSIGVTYKF